MSYKWIRTDEMVLRLADNANIPCVVGNSDFKVFQEYLAGGGQVDAADPPPAPIDLSDPDNQERALRAIMLVMAAGNGKTIPQAKAAFKAAGDSLG